MPNLSKVPGERGLYVNPSSGTYFVRIQTDGQDNSITLDTKRKGVAIDRMQARRAAGSASKLGLSVENPDKAAKKSATVASIINAYAEAGYPEKRENPRVDYVEETPGGLKKAVPKGRHGRCEMDNCATLLAFFNKGQMVQELGQPMLNEYYAWRKRNISKGAGARTTDLELNTLSNALGMARRAGKIDANPIEGRMHYHSSTSARHCRDLAPKDADELHEIAAALFGDRRSEVLGWQVLFEGLTGLRTNEALGLRMGARSDEPGGLTEDGGSLCVRRSKKSGRDNPYVQVHDGLKQVLEAHKAWHTQRYPLSPWCFPGRDQDGGKPADKSALTKALDRLFDQKVLKKKFTSHGLRAFCVRVRRSNGASDAQIAWEINHVGGVGTLEKVHGSAPPHWVDGKGPKLSWMPKGDPAWKKIKPVAS